jgi:Protein of unknown function (DUF1670)
MISRSDSEKRYSSAKGRFLKPVIKKFFQKEFPQLFGPVVREKIAEELIAIFENFSPETSRLKPGQLFWVALDKDTRADSPNCRYKPVIITIITTEDIEQLEKGIKQSIVAKNIIARMYNEVYQQGAILSTRDVALITLRSLSNLSSIRSSYEKEHDCILPHTGALHDMGSTISHKAAIVRKVVLEKKDPSIAAQETNHSQRAVDHYLKDYYRIKTVFENNQDVGYIHHVTGIANHVVKQYIQLLKNENEQVPTL